MRVRAKICGITRTEDALVAVQAGADALGFVFYPPSPRAVTADQAALVIPNVPAFVQTVGLFVNPRLVDLEAVLAKVSIGLLQFHGEEHPDFCWDVSKRTGKRWIKALTIKPDDTLESIVLKILPYQQAGCNGVLLDAWHPQLKGGTGLSFDWKQFPKNDPRLTTPVILAGGLTPENVTEAIEQTHPFAVDVSGGIEVVDESGQGIKGIKDPERICAFMRGVQQFDTNRW